MNKIKKLGLLFDELADELNITPTMLEKAETAYTALGEHIKSANENWDVSIYPQGSFELGTVIRPVNDEEEYDVDLVVLVKSPVLDPKQLREEVKTILLNHGRYEKKLEDRISFAYLYRIKVDDKYFLVKNARGTGKFQPVGGAFKMQPTEKSYISSVFHVTDDNKIKYDQTSKNDYRLFVPVKYLKKFISRFDQAKDREQISNLTREFSEEVISNGILKFNHIEYRYCGRHFTEISYSRVFNCYELLLADIVELKLTAEQESQLRALMSIESDKYYFATADEIKSCGVIGGTNKLSEFIADHATKILQENELNLIPSNSPNTISIDL